MDQRIILLLLASTFLWISGCKKDKDENVELKTQIVSQYATLVYANYQDAYDAAVVLHDEIDDFVAGPSATTLQEAKDAWLDAREPYGQTEAFRFGDGPIDDADGPEGLLNAWPLDESYIDYVSGSMQTGIVNDGTTNIDASTLGDLNEVGAEENISIGYHAIEFLLWGQDDPDVSLMTPGQRPYTDFVTGTGGTASNQDRRGLYLQVCADLLLTHLQSLIDDWNPSGSGNYYATFTGLETDEALRRMLSGIGILSKSELAGERIFTALDNQDQEDEHSCFADNTHRDIITNAIGIRNVYLGSYTRTNGGLVAGSSLSDLAAILAPTLDQEVRTLLDNSISNAESISVPFDQALTLETVGGSGPIQTTVNSLQQLGDKIAEVANSFDIIISTDLPE